MSRQNRQGSSHHHYPVSHGPPPGLNYNPYTSYAYMSGHVPYTGPTYGPPQPYYQHPGYAAYPQGSYPYHATSPYPYYPAPAYAHATPVAYPPASPHVHTAAPATVHVVDDAPAQPIRTFNLSSHSPGTKTYRLLKQNEVPQGSPVVYAKHVHLDSPATVPTAPVATSTAIAQGIHEKAIAEGKTYRFTKNTDGSYTAIKN